TIFTTICAGETERSTSCPTALARTPSTKVFTTGRATSASSSATRISRIAESTSASVSAPRRRSRSKTSLKRLLRLSNMAPLPSLNCANQKQPVRDTRGPTDPKPGQRHETLPGKRSEARPDRALCQLAGSPESLEGSPHPDPLPSGERELCRRDNVPLAPSGRGRGPLR